MAGSGEARRARRVVDDERSRIAAGLHDGAVQDFAGSAYALAALVRRDDLPDDVREVLVDVAQRVRQGVRSLRSVLVEVDPGAVHDEGLATALGDLLVRVHGRGVETSIETQVPVGATAPAHRVELLHRVALETVRAVLADPAVVSLAVHLVVDDAAWRLELRDATGPDGSAVTRAAERRARLRVLGERITRAGGTFAIEPCPPHATVVCACFPSGLSDAG